MAVYSNLSAIADLEIVDPLTAPEFGDYAHRFYRMHRANGRAPRANPDQ